MKIETYHDVSALRMQVDKQPTAQVHSEHSNPALARCFDFDNYSGSGHVDGDSDTVHSPESTCGLFGS